MAIANSPTSIDRRRLLPSAAAATATGILPSVNLGDAAAHAAAIGSARQAERRRPVSDPRPRAGHVFLRHVPPKNSRAMSLWRRGCFFCILIKLIPSSNKDLFGISNLIFVHISVVATCCASVALSRNDQQAWLHVVNLSCDSVGRRQSFAAER